MEPLELSFTVACPPEHAFAVWAGRTSMWWPHGHSVSAAPGLTVTFEPRPGGRIYERTPGPALPGGVRGVDPAAAITPLPCPGMAPPLQSNGLEVSTESTAGAIADESAQIVDVREDYEREAGYVDGSRHIQLAQLASGAAELDPERPVIFVCRVGGRSLMAAQALRTAGFDAYSMAGGVKQWADEGRPLAPDGGHVADH